jgi:hypothetical protein
MSSMGPPPDPTKEANSTGLLPAPAHEKVRPVCPAFALGAGRRTAMSPISPDYGACEALIEAVNGALTAWSRRGGPGRSDLPEWMAGPMREIERAFNRLRAERHGPVVLATAVRLGGDPRVFAGVLRWRDLRPGRCLELFGDRGIRTTPVRTLGPLPSGRYLIETRNSSYLLALEPGLDDGARVSA